MHSPGLTRISQALSQEACTRFLGVSEDQSIFYYKMIKLGPYRSILQYVEVNLLLHKVGPRRKAEEREKEGRDERKKGGRKVLFIECITHLSD